jgi:hypothetical protein
MSKMKDLDQGSRASDELEGKYKSNEACIENKRSGELGLIQSVPGRPLPAPIYRWLGLKEPVGFDTYYSVCIRY